MTTKTPPEHWLITRRQSIVMGVFLLLIALIVTVLYWKDRQQELRLREEQTVHRLELAYELISRDLERARSDALFMANQPAVRNFFPADEKSRRTVENEFRNFVRYKKTWQQIRLVDATGHETVRADWLENEARVVPRAELQDKKDRYYIRESLGLGINEVFVSEFDLNQEHGVIERPLNPVIRFVTPVAIENDPKRNLLVANYRGGPLLRDLAGISLPGQTFLIREDGQFLLGPTPNDSWGWLLNHPISFANRFPSSWKHSRESAEDFLLTSAGAFGFREIQLQRFGHSQSGSSKGSDKLLIVSYISSQNVFENSRQLLNRLLILVSVILLPVFIITRVWAAGSLRRRQQNRLIKESEGKLRELSSRLVKIQEDERRAISREIHDQLGQQATAINLDLKLACRDAQSGTVRAQLERAIDESEQLLKALHDFASRVRPVELDDLGLHDAVESHLWEFKDRSGIQFHLESNIDGVDLPSVVSENVYRLIQESLNNVVKHSNATRVDVKIEQTNIENQNVLNIVVRDDGTGPLNSVETDGIDGVSFNDNGRLGILGMRERVDLLGGTFHLRTEIAAGTKVEVSVPINNS